MFAGDVNAGHAPQRHAIVMRSGEQWFGLLVSALGPVTGLQLTGERGHDGPTGSMRTRGSSHGGILADSVSKVNGPLAQFASP
jgi:hypothetical protein